jgi:hypothetical protein
MIFFSIINCAVTEGIALNLIFQTFNGGKCPIDKEPDSNNFIFITGLWDYSNQ